MSESFSEKIFKAPELEKLLDTKSHPYKNICRVCNEEIPKSVIQNVAHLRNHKHEVYEFIECDSCGGEKFCDYAEGEDSIRGACETCNPFGDEPDEDRAYDEYKDAQAEAHFEELEKETKEATP